MKICTKCKIEKPEIEFYKDKFKKDGLRSDCKMCSSQRNRDFKFRHPEIWDKRMEKARIEFLAKKGYPEGTTYVKRKRGSGTIDKSGYVIICKKGHANSYGKSHDIAEHTYVMSVYLGRPLKKGETVHHKNGIKSDNRIENLELWSRNHPPGQRVEDKIEWCKEFLKEYGYKVQKE
jgi:hypothetical protein